MYFNLKHINVNRRNDRDRNNDLNNDNLVNFNIPILNIWADVAPNRLLSPNLGINQPHQMRENHYGTRLEERVITMLSDYLRERHRINPNALDILRFIQHKKENKHLNLQGAKKIPLTLKCFFNWTYACDIQPNIMANIDFKVIHLYTNQIFSRRVNL